MKETMTRFHIAFMSMGTHGCISAISSKGISFYGFLFAYSDDEILPKMDLLLKERIFSDRRKFFPFRVEPH